jgi:hypothetical protein
LNHICKNYKRNKKTEKEKEERKRKMWNWTPGTIPAHGQNEPMAQQHPAPNRYPLSLFLSLTAGPTYRHHQLRRILLPLFSLETAAGVYSPAVIARTNGPSRPIYKRPQHSVTSQIFFQYWISAMHHFIIHIFLHFKKKNRFVLFLLFDTKHSLVLVLNKEIGS